MLDLPNLASLREFRRRKRGWVKKRGQSPSAAVACCASMIGDTVEAVRRTREDAAALAFKLAELHAGDAKGLRATASLMRTHISCLHSVVQVRLAIFQHNSFVDVSELIAPCLIVLTLSCRWAASIYSVTESMKPHSKKLRYLEIYNHVPQSCCVKNDGFFTGLLWLDAGFQSCVGHERCGISMATYSQKYCGCNGLDVWRIEYTPCP